MAGIIKVWRRPRFSDKAEMEGSETLLIVHDGDRTYIRSRKSDEWYRWVDGLVWPYWIRDYLIYFSGTLVFLAGWLVWSVLQ